MIDTRLSAASSARQSSILMQDLRATLNDLQRQLATGEKSATYGGLGADRFTTLDLQGRLAKMDGYSGVMQASSLRISLMDQSLNGLNKIVAKAQEATRSGTYEPDVNGRPVAQVTAIDQMKAMIDQMNIDMGGQYLFSGRTTDMKPVVAFDELMDGAPGKAGLKQMIAERQAADLGTGNLGRLTAPSIAGATVTLERDAANPGAFGFTIAAINSTAANVTIGGPVGAQQTVTADFTGQPNDAETITVSLALPDGSTEQLILTATNKTPPPTGSFLIGGTPAATAANFQAALATAAQTAAQTSLKAASAVAASKAFFAGTPTTPPQRVPAPAATAAALVAGTAGDTVIWYRGDDDGGVGARNTAVAKVGDTTKLGTGARANEPALQQAFALIGALAVTNVAPSDVNGRVRYSELADRVREGLGFPNNMQTVTSIQMELATANAAINAEKERMTALRGVVQGSLDNARTADPKEITTAMLALQTRLEATYVTTSMLSKMSLVNYLS